MHQRCAALVITVIAGLLIACDCEPTVSVSPNDVSIAMECEQLWNGLLEVIPEATGMTPSATAAPCLERALVAQARHALVDGATLEDTGNNTVVLRVPSAKMVALVVWSITGRACTQSGSGDNDLAILEFEATQGRLRPRKPRCEFERSLYSSMLLVTVVLIVYLVVRPAEVEAGAEAEEVAAGAKGASSASLNAKAPMHSHAGSHAALPAVRYRLLRT